MEQTQSLTLFPTSLPDRQWLEFDAADFDTPVSGAIFRSDDPPCCGMPLGGLGTGCLDLDVRGVFGFSSLFNPFSDHPVYKNWRMPRKPPFLQPFLGISAGGKTWVLCTPEVASGEVHPWCTEPQMLEREGKQPTPLQVGTARLEGVEFSSRIHYWGHYPVADLEFETSCPVSVGLRAWAPFIPGDAATSNIPAIIFEVHLRNPGQAEQNGSLAFSFGGPDFQESGGSAFRRMDIDEEVRGVWVRAAGEVEYLLGLIGAGPLRYGIGLGETPEAWAKIDKALPQGAWHEVGGERLYQQGSASLAVDFRLPAGESRTLRFVLAWYSPQVQGVTHTWEGEGAYGEGHLRMRWIGSQWAGNTHTFRQMYAARFASALDVARTMAAQHDLLLQRVLAWQSAFYTHPGLPAWLRDALINNLALFAEDSHWFQPRLPLPAAVFPQGAFALNESPRGCPHMACIPCDWYGNLPVVFFFPELARSTLKLFREYQLENGEIPFALGKIADLPDMATPEYYWQVSLNGMCYIDIVDRLWLRTGDGRLLDEFYASVKRCNTFLMDLNKSPGGPIRMPEIGGMEWFEFGEWAGMAAHMGGLRLAQLRMVQRMAEKVGDELYARQCQAWLAEGQQALEGELWTGSYYLNFYEPETGKKSEDVMGYQLDGEWAARIHGLEGVFQPDRVKTTLETIRRFNVALAPAGGAANFTRPDGSPLPAENRVAYYGTTAYFLPELLVLAMTYIQAGEKEFGLELAGRCWETMCLKKGYMWDLPNMARGDNGERLFGTDYYQNMMLWALPAVLAGEDLRTASRPGGFIDRIIQA